jgi:hypothetical protein
VGTQFYDIRSHTPARITPPLKAFGAVAAYELDGSAEQRAQLDAQQPCWQVGCDTTCSRLW